MHRNNQDGALREYDHIVRELRSVNLRMETARLKRNRILRRLDGMERDINMTCGSIQASLATLCESVGKLSAPTSAASSIKSSLARAKLVSLKRQSDKRQIVKDSV